MKLRTLAASGLTGFASLILAALLAYLTRWWTVFTGAIILLGGLVGFVLILMALLAWGVAKIKQGIGSVPIKKPMLLVGIFLLLQLAYIPFSQALRQWEVARAQAFVESLIPDIEAYKELRDTYPDAQEAIMTGEISPPALLQLHGDFPLPYDNRQFYFQSDSTYAFRFYYPDGFIGYSYEYCCGPQGRWTVTD